MAVRIAFIGAGGIAKRQMEHIYRIDGAEVVAVCDLQEDRARQAAARNQCKAFTDWRQMFEDVAFDALWVAVPPHGHEGQEQMAAAKGIHLMVEKPIANTLERGNAIQSAIDRAGIVNAVGYHWRYRADLEHVRSRFDAGRLALARGYWCGGFPTVGWWRKRELSAGQFVEQTTHMVDLARYLIGEISEVSARFVNQTKRDVEGFDIWDAGVVTAQFQNGALGVFCNTCVLPANQDVGLHLHTTDGTFRIEMDTVRFQEAGRTTEFKACDDPYFTQAQAFVQAIDGNRDAIRSCYADAIKTLEVTLKATTAAVTGETARL